MKRRRRGKFPSFTVRIESNTLLEVFYAAVGHHQDTATHDPDRCRTCRAIERVEEELEMGKLEAIADYSKERGE